MARGPYVAISFLILAAKLVTTIVAHQSKRLPIPGIDRLSTVDSVTFQIVFYDLKILRPVIKGHLFALFRLINQTSSYGNTPLFSFEKQHLQCVDGTASSPHCLLTTVKWGFAFTSLCCNNPLVSMPTFPKRQATSFCCLPLLAM